MKLSEMMQWLIQLLPKQKATGSGNAQAGHIGGDFNNSQTTSQNVYIFINNEQAEKPVVVEPASQPPVQLVQDVTPEHRSVLRFMREDEELNALALTFMDAKFKSTYVKGLDAWQAYRVRRYLETCASNRVVNSGKNSSKTKREENDDDGCVQKMQKGSQQERQALRPLRSQSPG